MSLNIMFEWNVESNSYVDFETGIELKHIPDLPKFFAGSDGNIYSINAWNKNIPKKLKGYKHKNGYKYFKLNIGNYKYKNFGNHTLVCTAFHGKKPLFHECSHLDDNKDNNIPENLRWHTRKQNLKIREEIRGGWKGGLNHGRKKRFNENQIIEIKRMLYQGIMGTKIAKKFACSKSTIYEIKWGHIYK